VLAIALSAAPEIPAKPHSSRAAKAERAMSQPVG
jgi:hypothetical protein